MPGESKRRRWLPPLRLRHKLGISLVITALLPVLVASWVAVSVVLRSLDHGLHQDTDRQLHVGINLLLRNVERLGHEAVSLSGSPELAAAFRQPEPGRADAMAKALARLSPHLPWSLVQLADADGIVKAQRVVGQSLERFEGLAVTSSSPMVEAGRTYERRVTIVPIGQQLVVRASAPVVDDNYQLLGVVVLSMPLDEAVVGSVKAALGTDVLIFAGTTPGQDGTTTFIDRIGRPVDGVELPADVAEQVRARNTVFRTAEVNDDEYAMAFTPVINLDGEIVGVFAVAIDRAPLVAARAAATRSLALGAAGAFVFALGLAGLLSRRITRPIAHLHAGAVSIARGDLDHEIEVSEGDEIGDLAAAFSHMTTALKDNQRRLAARMREIVALHDAGRAVSSVIELDQVLRKIVDSVARVLHVRVCALWLVSSPDEQGGRREGSGRHAVPVRLELGAARAKREDMRVIIEADEVAEMVDPLRTIADEVAAARSPVRILRVSDDEGRRDAAVSAGITGSLVATPLERKGSVVGVIIIGRAVDARPFSEADASLLATFADQAATAIENASLYHQLRSWSAELEQKVELRTAELTHMNEELGRTIHELRDTQAQLILSERLAGLGQLVAGVAHEINSPSAAIRGTVDGLGAMVGRLTTLSHQLAELDLADDERDRLITITRDISEGSSTRRFPSPAAVRRQGRELRETLESDGLDASDAAEVARTVAELHLSDERSAALVDLVRRPGLAGAGARARIMTSYVAEYVQLHRGLGAIDHAIKRIQRIVGGLKSYSHLDQDAGQREADIHEGIEDTIELLDHLLAHGITVTRRYGEIPRVSVYVDELNQVWTNLIHNAVQALDGQGEITIETEALSSEIAVRVIDNGPGIPNDLKPRIFEAFFTTKPRGEGSGLGLSIVRQILERHGGTIQVDSAPGRTCFEVRLPFSGGGTEE